MMEGSADEKHKILICGHVNGNISQLYKKVNAVGKKCGSFDLLLCVGDFFGPSDEDWLQYKTGVAKASIETYLLGPSKENLKSYYPDINGGELAPNITYLGKRGLFSTSIGLKIAYLSGCESSTDENCRITHDDVTRLRNSCVRNQTSDYIGVDILLTSEWPSNVTNLDPNSVSETPKGSDLISKLAAEIKPRYHFCPSSKYYERPPYRNKDTGSGVHITRVIAVAPSTNKDNEKWLYAVTLKPMINMKRYELTQQTTNTTDCPYPPVPFNKQPHQQFFFNMGENQDDTEKKKRPYKPKMPIQMNISQSDCWFCLASTRFEKHLVVCIGEGAYLTLAKGGLVDDHVLVLPVSHYSKYHEMPNSVRDEIEKFKKALKKMYESFGKVPVFFERNYKTPHYQLQVVPVDKKFTPLVKEAFMNHAEFRNVSLIELPEGMTLEYLSQMENSYFYVEFPSNEKYFHVIKRTFPLQFGREALADKMLLNVPQRIQWKECEISKEEEGKLTEKFRNKFKPFDFTTE